MKVRRFDIREEGGRTLARLALCGALLCLWPLSASAQIVDPFAAQGAWVSLDQFEGQHPSSQENAQTTQAAVSAPAVAAPQEALAPPVRAVDLPVLPTVGAQTRLAVSSSVDEHEAWYREQKKWQTFEEADQEIEQQTEAEKIVSILGRDPFKVRFASLPSAMRAIHDVRVSKSIADRDAESQKAQQEDQKKVAAALPPKPTPKEEKKLKETNAACEAFADYRRRQLEAMENDRQTLSALQAALVELGLSKDLEFMTKGSSVLSSNATVQTATPNAPQTSQTH